MAMGGLYTTISPASAMTQSRLDPTSQALPLPQMSVEQGDSARVDRRDVVQISAEGRALAESAGAVPTAQGEEAEGAPARTGQAEESGAVLPGNGDGEEGAEESGAAGASSSAQDQGVLSEEELLEVDQLKQRDQEVRLHEAAHAAVGGPYAGAPQMTYATGPDGRRYAVSGEVNVDLSAVPGDPAATIEKMRVVQAAALAPAQPSSQDYRVAARAMQKAAQARMEMASQDSHEAGPALSTNPSAKEEVISRGSTGDAVTKESLKWKGAVA